MEISEMLRLLLQKCHEWELPILVAKQDVHKAFDSMEHADIHAELGGRGVSLELHSAVSRETHARLDDRFSEWCCGPTRAIATWLQTRGHRDTIGLEYRFRWSPQTCSASLDSGLLGNLFGRLPDAS